MHPYDDGGGGWWKLGYRKNADNYIALDFLFRFDKLKVWLLEGMLGWKGGILFILFNVRVWAMIALEGIDFFQAL